MLSAQHCSIWLEFEPIVRDILWVIVYCVTVYVFQALLEGMAIPRFPSASDVIHLGSAGRESVCVCVGEKRRETRMFWIGEASERKGKPEGMEMTGLRAGESACSKEYEGIEEVRRL